MGALLQVILDRLSKEFEVFMQTQDWMHICVHKDMFIFFHETSVTAVMQQTYYH